MPKKKNPQVEQLKLRMIAIRKSGLLPPNYAKRVKARLEVQNKWNAEWKIDKVYDVTKGASVETDIVDELLKLARENKLQQQIFEADDILK